MTLSEGHWIEKKILFIDLLSDYLHSKLDGHCLNSFENNQTFIIFMLKICVTMNEDQGHYS